ncbi:MAG: GNAT family N-acetyltransferase [Calditrichaeota bacterium]|nr:GNAT family N-acetyltransferase [Calditrichota bacterium]
MKPNLVLRKIEYADCRKISEAFKDQGWNKPVAQYEEYVQFQERGERDIIIAELNGAFAGYLTIKWESDYQPFAIRGIPEIVDFNVLKKFQRRGIGTSLMDEAEARIKKVSDYAGIGFGVYQDYGAAQILYVNRGYIPDGKGIVRNSVPLKYGDEIRIDDSIVFCLTKQL